MTMQTTPYLSFDGRAEEAMTFYQSALGGRLDIMRAKEMPMDGMQDWDPEGVMHSALVIDDRTILMASDGASGAAGSAITVCLWGEDAAELEAAFGKLSDGGDVHVPWSPSPWGSHFGQFVDRFGIPWMLEGGAAE